MEKWITERMCEPSTYAAIGLAVVGVGVLMNNAGVIIAGVVAGVGAFILKERGLL
tara:strand:- start:195 stop:359 length:165 start_codon:yes stop_codon:yes gene_type:complete